MEMSLSEWDVLCVAFIFLYEVTCVPNILKSCSSFISTLLHIYKWTVTKTNIQTTKKPSNDQSVKLMRPTSLSEGQTFWLFEGRIGWGSCKLPNNLSAQLCTVLDITMFHVYLDHTEAFDVDPSPG